MLVNQSIFLQQAPLYNTNKMRNILNRPQHTIEKLFARIYEKYNIHRRRRRTLVMCHVRFITFSYVCVFFRHPSTSIYFLVFFLYLTIKINMCLCAVRLSKEFAPHHCGLGIERKHVLKSLAHSNLFYYIFCVCVCVSVYLFEYLCGSVRGGLLMLAKGVINLTAHKICVLVCLFVAWRSDGGAKYNFFFSAFFELFRTLLF